MRRKINLDVAYRHPSKNSHIQRSITDFLNKEYREYSNYVIATRAIPSIWDGMKVGARKILYSAFTGGLKDGSEKKVLNLVGDVFNKTLYAHGDQSIIGSIMSMGAKFTDNLNPIDIKGQGGSLRNPKSMAAPRYLFCKLSEFSKLYKTDEDLLDYVFDEGEFLEPVHFLPIIPLVLTARTEGMAPGYKFNSFSYNPLDIIDACMEIIKTGKIKTVIRPYVRGILQERFTYDAEEGRWYNVGTWNTDVRNDVLQITNLPYDVSYNKIEKKLNACVDSGYIKEWKNFSHDNIIDYRVIFDKSKLAREIQADRIDKTLKMFYVQSVVPEDHLYVLNEEGKVRHFATKEDLVIYFVKMRLGVYQLRKDKMVKVKTKILEDNINICRFIELVNSGKIKIKNRPIKEVRADIESYKLPGSLLSVPMSRLTKDEYDELMKKNEEIKKEIEYIQNTKIEQMYLDDLKALKKSLQDKF